MTSASISRKKSDAGRIGGLQTYLKHGRAHMAAMGRLGGRPRLATLEEIRESQRTEEKENEDRRKDTARLSLKHLRELWRSSREKPGK